MVREPVAAAQPDHVGAHQRDRHRGQPARRADGPVERDHPARRGSSRSRSPTPSAARATPGRWGRRRCSARWPRWSTSWCATRWRRCGSKSIDCDVQIEPGRKVAQIESVRLLSDTVEPGHELKAFVTLKPFKGERETIEVAIPIPADFPEGPGEAVFCDAANSIRRTFRNDPALLEPRDLDGVIRTIRLQTEPKRTAVYVHVPSPERGLSVKGRPCPTCRGACGRSSPRSGRRRPRRSAATWCAACRRHWVVEGPAVLRFTVAKDAGLSLSLIVERCRAVCPAAPLNNEERHEPSNDGRRGIDDIPASSFGRCSASASRVGAT